MKRSNYHLVPNGHADNGPIPPPCPEGQWQPSAASSSRREPALISSLWRRMAAWRRNSDRTHVRCNENGLGRPFGTSRGNLAVANPAVAGLGYSRMSLRDKAPGSVAGFTMIEIALSLAIIGFALVAIIGILPACMSVQRENTDETVINHESSVLLDAVCNGQQGLDDLTNYVVAITNYQTIYKQDGGLAPLQPNPRAVWYTPTGSGIVNGNPPGPEFPLINGNRIVGLLSTPKWVIHANPITFYLSNHVVATFRSMTGLASEKAPQNNATVQEMAFAYRLTSEVVPYGCGELTVFPGVLTNANNFLYQDWTNYTSYLTDTNQWVPRSNYWLYAKNLEQDLYDVRFLFRWPVTPMGLPANGRGGRQVVRSMANGPILASPIAPGYPTAFPASLHYQLYYVQPNLFLKAP